MDINENTTTAAPASKYAAKRNAKASKINLEKDTPKDAEEVSESKFDMLASKFGKENVSIALLLKNNAEIRRFTSLAIINYLSQKGEIKGEHKYVAFKWDKFSVKCDNLMREFSYKEDFFVSALIGSFASFANSAQKTISEFLDAYGLNVPKSE